MVHMIHHTILFPGKMLSVSVLYTGHVHEPGVLSVVGDSVSCTTGH